MAQRAGNKRLDTAPESPRSREHDFFAKRALYCYTCSSHYSRIYRATDAFDDFPANPEGHDSDRSSLVRKTSRTPKFIHRNFEKMRRRESSFSAGFKLFSYLLQSVKLKPISMHREREREMNYDRVESEYGRGSEESFVRGRRRESALSSCGNSRGKSGNVGVTRALSWSAKKRGRTRKSSRRRENAGSAAGSSPVLSSTLYPRLAIGLGSPGARNREAREGNYKAWDRFGSAQNGWTTRQRRESTYRFLISVGPVCLASSRSPLSVSRPFLPFNSELSRSHAPCPFRVRRIVYSPDTLNLAPSRL